MFSALPPAIPTQGSSWSPSQPGSPALPSNLGPFQRPARPQRPSGSPTSHLWAWLCSNCLLGAPLLLLRGSQFSVALGGQNSNNYSNSGFHIFLSQQEKAFYHWRIPWTEGFSILSLENPMDRG